MSNPLFPRGWREVRVQCGEVAVLLWIYDSPAHGWCWLVRITWRKYGQSWPHDHFDDRHMRKPSHARQSARRCAERELWALGGAISLCDGVWPVARAIRGADPQRTVTATVDGKEVAL